MYRGTGERHGRKVGVSNRKPTTAGENTSRYYSRTSKVLFFHSWELYLSYPTSSLSLSLSPFCARHLSVSRIFHDPGNISSMRCGTPRSFRGCGKEANGAYSSTLTSLVARVRKRGKVELLDNLLSSSLSAEASTHDEFIKHREATACCPPRGIKSGRSAREATDDSGIFIYCYCLAQTNGKSGFSAITPPSRACKRGLNWIARCLRFVSDSSW